MMPLISSANSTVHFRTLLRGDCADLPLSLKSSNAVRIDHRSTAITVLINSVDFIDGFHNSALSHAMLRYVCVVMLPVDMADAQKAPRRRKCKNHLVQLAEMFPDIAYHVAASYGSSEDQIYVMEVNVEGSVIPFFIFFKLLNNSNNNHNSVYGGIIVTR